MSEGQGNSTGTEGGGGFGLFKHALPWSNTEDPILSAEKNCRFVVANLAGGCSKVFLYSAHAYVCLAVAPNFVTLVGPDGYPSVETAAFSNMAWELEGSKIVRAIKLNNQINAYLFSGRNGMIAVISGFRNGKYQTPRLPGLTITDLFGNPSDGCYKGTLLYVESMLSADQLAAALTPAS